ncbi:DNA replication endonuclease-helicase Dna2 [Bonamia ostreae]|uniref:DNA replication ATP-dependent helicase/nuclease n=1 Tax=Bonamia ostreae TaxID=126728 RepID=A0ABV2AI87_9EUKA
MGADKESSSQADRFSQTISQNMDEFEDIFSSVPETAEFSQTDPKIGEAAEHKNKKRKNNNKTAPFADQTTHFNNKAIDKQLRILKIRYYTITDVRISSQNMAEQLEITVKDRNSESSATEKLFLRENWVDAIFAKGDKLNLVSIGDGPTQNYNCVDNSSPSFAVLHPDLLINSTSISTSFDCVRKTIVSETYKNYGMTNKNALLGCLAHELFQQCLENKVFTKSFVLRSLEAVITRNRIDLFSQNINREEANAFLRKYVDRIAKWGPFYFRESPIKNNLCIGDVYDIEELILSPNFGVKAKLDASVQIHHNTRNRGNCVEKTKLLGPLEIKSDQLKNFDETTIQKISKGDKVVINIQNGPVCVGTGTVIKRRDDYVEVMSENRINEKILNRFQHKNFEICLSENRGAFSYLQNVLLSIFVNDSFHERKRKLIDRKVESLLKKLDLFGDFAKLNFSQQNAVTKSLEVEDYCLIFGMPGTGKSTTITFLLQLLNKLKKKVLVATYTHSALTHLLLKLAAKKVPFVYAGKMTPQCDSVVAENHIRAISDRCDKDQTFYRRIENNFIFAATSLSTGSSFLQSQNFDYCIIDEASQMSEIACLGGLRLADKFILVGDHFQLSPLVRSDAAKRAGMEISLFERLFAEHKTSTIALTSQYRMNSDILKLPNNLFYQNKLFCGSEKVKTAVLSVVASETKTALLPKWLKSVLSPKNSLIFLNTDKMEAIERREKNSDREIIINKGELVVIEKILDLFESAGLAKSQISVLSTYKSQTTVFILTRF